MALSKFDRNVKQLVEDAPRKRVLVLGGGFAGLTVAMELEKKLAADASVEVTLVNRDNHHHTLEFDSLVVGLGSVTNCRPRSHKERLARRQLSALEFHSGRGSSQHSKTWREY